MKITVDKKHLLRVLQQVSRAVPSGKPALPITSCVYLRAVAAVAGDKPAAARALCAGTDIARSVRCRVDARVEEGGAVALPAVTLLGLAKSFPDGEIAISSDTSGRATLSAGKTRAMIVGQNVAEFPRVYSARDEGVALVRIQSQALLTVLAQVRHAAADSSRPNMHGIFLGPTAAMAIDGSRAVALTIDWDGPAPVDAAGVMLPGPALGLIEDLCKAGPAVEFGAGKGWIFGRGEGCEIALKQQEVPFPVSTAVVVQAAVDGVRSWMIASRMELLAALGRFEALAHGPSSGAARIGTGNARLVLRFESPAGAVDDEIGAVWRPVGAAADGGAPLVVQAEVVIKYLREHLAAALGQADVAVGFGATALDPVVIRAAVPSGHGGGPVILDTWTGLIMPLMPQAGAGA